MGELDFLNVSIWLEFSCEESQMISTFLRLGNGQEKRYWQKIFRNMITKYKHSCHFTKINTNYIQITYTEVAIQRTWLLLLSHLQLSPVKDGRLGPYYRRHLMLQINSPMIQKHLFFSCFNVHDFILCNTFRFTYFLCLEYFKLKNQWTE